MEGRWRWVIWVVLWVGWVVRLWRTAVPSSPAPRRRIEDGGGIVELMLVDGGGGVGVCGWMA